MTSSPHPPARAVRTVLIRSGVAVVVLTAVWLVTGRWSALVIDAIHTTRLATLPSYRIGWDGSWFRLDSGIPGTLKPKDPWLSPFRWDSSEQRVSMKIDPDGHLVLIEGGRQFVLGKRAGTLSDSEPTPAFEAEPGDTTSITLDLSLVSFPTPLDINWMGVRSPSWKRYLYCHLSWTKISGARLDMLWRYEQGYFREGGWGWSNPLGGLVRVDIRDTHKIALVSEPTWQRRAPVCKGLVANSGAGCAIASISAKNLPRRVCLFLPAYSACEKLP